MQPHDGRAEVRVRCVPEVRDRRILLEFLLNRGSLDAPTAAVHEAHQIEAGMARRVEVLLDDRGDFTRRKGMEVEKILDRKPDGVARFRGALVAGHAGECIIHT